MVYETAEIHGGHELVLKSTMTTVKPALPMHEHRLPLSNLDLLLPALDVSVFFCYRHPAPTASALQEALAKVLVAYYPLAGEVVANAAGEPELLCSGRGVDFVEANADGSQLQEVRLALPDESAEKLVPVKKAGVISVQAKLGTGVGTALSVRCSFLANIMQNYSKLNKLPTILEEDEDESDRGDGYNGPTFRCSVQKVYSVISQFDQQKRDIVSSMGWGGTLSMPLISKLSVRHMVWLLGMGAVMVKDTTTRSIHLAHAHQTI